MEEGFRGCGWCGAQLVRRASEAGRDWRRRQYCNRSCSTKAHPPPHEVIPVEERFWAKVDKNGPIPEFRPDLGPCHVWLGALQPNGYGSFGVAAGDVRRAHRFAYELSDGPLGVDLEPDHLCRNRACVNRGHMEAVTHKANCLRGATPIATNARKSHCSRGHPLSGENLILDAEGRRCRTCRNDRQRERYEAHPRPVPSHCKRGHEFTEENTYRHGGRRHCRACATRRRHRATAAP